ncbi:MAG: LptF/LptG family permease, partial [Planctomycetota bacterium]
IRLLIRDSLFYKHVVAQLTGPGNMFVIEDDNRRYEVRARKYNQDEDDLKPTLEEVEVTETQQGRERKYKADRCPVKIRRGFGEESDVMRLVLEDNVSFRDTDDPTNIVHHRRYNLASVSVPRVIHEQAAGITDAEVISEGIAIDQMPSLGLGLRIDDARKSLRKEIDKLAMDITGIIHSRLAFSASVLVTLVLAAALGVIFRGGELLTAFVISFIPGMLIVVMNITGRQLTENSGTHLIGIVVIWSGIVLLALVDGMVLARYLRR